MEAGRTPERDRPAASGNGSPPPESSSGWTGGRVFALVAVSIVGLIGLLLLLGGLAAIGAHLFLRDDDGFINSGEEVLESTGYAVTAEDIDLGSDPADWAPSELLGTARIEVESADGAPVFVGIADEDDLDAYLRRTPHSEVTEFDIDGDPDYEEAAGPRAPKRPGAQDFWEISSSGPGEQVVDWEVESGVWSIAIMNADGSREVEIDAEAGIKIEWLIWAGVGLILLGLVFTAIAVVLTLLISRAASARPPPESSGS